MLHHLDRLGWPRKVICACGHFAASARSAGVEKRVADARDVDDEDAASRVGRAVRRRPAKIAASRARRTRRSPGVEGTRGCSRSAHPHRHASAGRRVSSRQRRRRAGARSRRSAGRRCRAPAAATSRGSAARRARQHVVHEHHAHRPSASRRSARRTPRHPFGPSISATSPTCATCGRTRVASPKRRSTLARPRRRSAATGTSGERGSCSRLMTGRCRESRSRAAACFGRARGPTRGCAWAPHACAQRQEEHFRIKDALRS